MSSEMLRNELASSLSFLTPEQYKEVLEAFDRASSGYDIERKKMDLIALDGIPEAVKHYLAAKAIGNCSPKTLAQYRYKLLNFFAVVRKPIQSITSNDVRVYLYNVKQEHGISDRYLDNIRVVLNTFFQWCAMNDYLLKNPCAKIEHIKYQPKEREPLTAYELELFRWNCKDIRERAIVDFIFSTGCRVSECVQVDLSDINWSNRSVVIRHGKGDKRRTVFFNAESELTLRKYLETRTDDNPALFVSSRKPHGRLSNRAVQVIFAKISKRASTVKAYPHKLRHTFATMGIRAGMPVERLQALLGHANPSTTMIYAKLDFTDLQREHQRAYA